MQKSCPQDRSGIVLFLQNLQQKAEPWGTPILCAR